MILIKVEDREQFGQGNRSRGIAIAQSLSRIGVKYCIISSTLKWFVYLKSNGFSAILIDKNYDSDLETDAIISYFKSSKIDFIILDGDRFDFNYLNLLNSNQIRTVVLDDVAIIVRNNAWRLINPNIYASEQLYKGWNIKTYLGGDYVLLREAFLLESHIKPIENKVLLALGVMLDEDSTFELARRLNEIGFSTKIAEGFTTEQMVEEIDSSAVTICGVSVTLHEVWSRNRFAIPVYQAKDQILFHEYLKANNIPQVISINKSKAEVINNIILITRKITKNTHPKLNLSKDKVDKLFKELLNEAQ
jgi:hypothetical protein